jgi:hypothetical protein
MTVCAGFSAAKKLSSLKVILMNFQTNSSYTSQEKTEIRTREVKRIEGKSKTFNLTEAYKLSRTKKKS